MGNLLLAPTLKSAKGDATHTFPSVPHTDWFRRRTRTPARRSRAPFSRTPARGHRLPLISHQPRHPSSIDAGGGGSRVSCLRGSHPRGAPRLTIRRPWRRHSASSLRSRQSQLARPPELSLPSFLPQVGKISYFSRDLFRSSLVRYNMGLVSYQRGKGATL
jgi:hypothetical protein